MVVFAVGIADATACASDAAIISKATCAQNAERQDEMVGRAKACLGNRALVVSHDAGTLGL